MLLTKDNARTVLAEMFPHTRHNSASSGFIAMDFFNANEKVLRVYSRANGYRVIYRGPRRGNAAHTRRADATHAVFYYA